MTAVPAWKSVICHSEDPDERKHPRSVGRAFCAMQPTPSCPSCPNSNFKVTFQIGIGSQEVACPQWEDATSRADGKNPIEYVPMVRRTCLQTQPYEFCPSCINSKPDNLPETQPGWYEQMKRRAER